MTENELQNGDSEAEILSADDQKLRQMCKDLKKINAPKNFDFHLKARIAKANADDFQTASLIPFLRYFLPFSVVVLLAVFVGFNIFLTTGNSADSEFVKLENQPKQIQENPVVNPKVEKTVSSNILPITANFVANEEKSTVQTNIEKRNSNTEAATVQSNKKDIQPKSKENEIQSRDSAVKDPKIFTPKGIFPNLANGKSAEPVNQIFDFIGITAVLDAGKWKVTAVEANNMAGNAGVRIGDLIDAIDGNKLGASSEINGTVNIKIIQIIRDGKNISLQMRK